MLIKTQPWKGFYAYVVPDTVWAQGPFAVNCYLFNVMVGIESKFEFAHADDQKDAGIKIFFSETDKRDWKEEREMLARAYASIVLADRKRADITAKQKELDDDDEWI